MPIPLWQAESLPQLCQHSTHTHTHTHELLDILPIDTKQERDLLLSPVQTQTKLPHFQALLSDLEAYAEGRDRRKEEIDAHSFS